MVVVNDWTYVKLALHLPTSFSKSVNMTFCDKRARILKWTYRLVQAQQKNILGTRISEYFGNHDRGDWRCWLLGPMVQVLGWDLIKGEDLPNKKHTQFAAIKRRPTLICKVTELYRRRTEGERKDENLKYLGRGLKICQYTKVMHARSQRVAL